MLIKLFLVLFAPKGTYKCLDSDCGALQDGSAVYVRVQRGKMVLKCGKYRCGGMLRKYSDTPLTELLRPDPEVRCGAPLVS